MHELDALPHLSAEAQRRHATMVLGGWRFERLRNIPLYVAVDPQGYTAGSGYTLFTAVDAAWYLHGGNGK